MAFLKLGDTPPYYCSGRVQVCQTLGPPTANFQPPVTGENVMSAHCMRYTFL